MNYSLIRRIHFYIAVTLAVPLTILSITGALLVYGPELQAIISPQGWKVQGEGQKLSLVETVDKVKQQRPDLNIWAITTGKEGNKPYTAYLADNKGVLNINPYSGEILVNFRPKETFQGWVTALHRRLLIDGDAARWVRHGVSTIALLLIIELIIGLWMWLKPAKPFERLVIKSGYSTRMKVMRLHQLTGIATAILLFFVAFTGLAMYWREPAKAIVETVTFSKVEKNEPPKMIGLKPIKNLEQAVDLGIKSFPNSELKLLKLPDKNSEAVVLTMDSEYQDVPSKVWVGDEPLRVLHVDDGTKTSTATWFWHLLYPIHVGDFAGSIVRFLWLFVALTPLAFVISGIWLYAKRRKTKNREA